VPVFAAVDVGASGGRVMAGVVDGDDVALEAVHRFANGVVERDGHLRWELQRLLDEIVRGLAMVTDAASIGIDTWGVDYGLLDDDGVPVADPIAYRDDRTAKVIDDVHARVSPEELYAITGVQFLPFNTIYQLVAEQQGPSWERAAQAVLLPDLIATYLTGGAPATELTNASTTGLLDLHTGAWSTTLLDRLAIPRDLLPPVEAPGALRGATVAGTPVVSVGSHDTASAVVGVPATTDRFAYIASGTWSLVGLELAAPVLTEAARAANFTNEVGVDGRTRFLRNVGGLWLLQECLRAWGRDDLDALLDEAGRLPSGGLLIDVDDPSFIPPGTMPERVARAAGDLTMAAMPARTVRCILDSLARGYARTVEQAVVLAGAAVDVIHVVGGGSQNALLCQLTADASGRPVVAGPVEATALGNVLVQARAAGAAASSLEALRASIAATTPLRRYEPR
jgi:rhamnulokinase